jgi:hypothetical protein
MRLALLSYSALSVRDLPPSTITLHSDQDFDLQVFFDNTPAVVIPLQLYVGDKLVHSAIADQNGKLRLAFCPMPNTEL